MKLVLKTLLKAWLQATLTAVFKEFKTTKSILKIHDLAGLRVER
jgi:hypothetical protein